MKLGVRSQLVFVSLLLILVIGTLAGLFLEHQRRNAIEQQIEQELLHYAASARELMIESKATATSQFDQLANRLGRATTSRITIIALDGRVLGDSKLSLNEVQLVENHGQRPEVLEAITTGKGIYRRYSTTLETEMLYVALPFGEPEIIGTVRAAKPLSEVDFAITELRLTLMFTGLIALLLAIILSGLASHLLTGTLRKLIRHAKSLPTGSHSSHDDIELLAGSFDHLAKKLASHISELRRMEHDQRQFIANASHELRTPIAVIRANAETLLDGAIEDRVMGPKLLQALDRNAERLALILSDLLNLARLDAKQAHLNLTKLKLADYVANAVESLEVMAEKQSINISIDLDKATNLKADPKALQQILLNLIENAIKYAPPSGQVTIKSQQQDDQLLITVEDNGPGVPESCREKVFQRFYRIDSGRSREVGGTGLGLAIVKTLVESMGGKVGVKPVEPTGSIFWLTLPLG